LLYEVKNDQKYLQQALSWVDILDQYYIDPDAGGYFLTASDCDDLIVRSKTVIDNVYPSGNSVMIDVLTRLAVITGESKWVDQSEKIISAFSPDSLQSSLGQFSFLDHQLFQENACQIVCVGDGQTEEGSKMREILNQGNPANRVISTIPDPSALPSSHPAYNKQAIDDLFTVYICRGQTCGMPINQAEVLHQELTRG